MPNRITPEELENLHLPELGLHVHFKPAGWIQPTSATNSCEAVVDDVTPCALYCEIVEGHAMKFGTTGSVQGRQKLNERTINNILAYQDRRYRGTNKKITDPSTYDKYKRQAPEVIRSGRGIEIWAIALSSQSECQHPLKKFDARCAACKDVEGALNDRYKAVKHGWASRRN